MFWRWRTGRELLPVGGFVVGEDDAAEEEALGEEGTAGEAQGLEPAAPPPTWPDPKVTRLSERMAGGERRPGSGDDESGRTR